MTADARKLAEDVLARGLCSGVHPNALARALLTALDERDRLQHFIDCADTPLMRDVLAERDALQAALREIADADAIWKSGRTTTYAHAQDIARAALSPPVEPEPTPTQANDARRVEAILKHTEAILKHTHCNHSLSATCPTCLAVLQTAQELYARISLMFCFGRVEPEGEEQMPMYWNEGFE